jgi:hypothetical protein
MEDRITINGHDGAVRAYIAVTFGRSSRILGN